MHIQKLRGRRRNYFSAVGAWQVRPLPGNEFRVARNHALCPVFPVYRCIASACLFAPLYAKLLQLQGQHQQARKWPMPADAVDVTAALLSPWHPTGPWPATASRTRDLLSFGPRERPGACRCLELCPGPRRQSPRPFPALFRFFFFSPGFLDLSLGGPSPLFLGTSEALEIVFFAFLAPSFSSPQRRVFSASTAMWRGEGSWVVRSDQFIRRARKNRSLK